MENDKDKGEVKCEKCGSDDFKLFFGSYKLVGVCVKCKNEQDVYVA